LADFALALLALATGLALAGTGLAATLVAGLAAGLAAAFVTGLALAGAALAAALVLAGAWTDFFGF
jgi:hypothetical protein